MEKIEKAIETEFSELDLAVARVACRRMIAAGARKGPSDLLLISEATFEQWLKDDAKAYLREQKVRQQAVIAELP